MVKKENKINWMLFVAIFLVLASVIAFIISLNMDSIVTLQENEIPIAVRIANYSALNISKNQYDFNLGTIKSGSSGVRNISISNDYPFKTSFEFEVVGNISSLIIFQNAITLEPFENRGVTFRTKVIENESLGDYTGTIIVKIRKIPE